MSDEDDNIFFDPELEAALIEQEKGQKVRNEQPLQQGDSNDDDEFDDDLDLGQLVEVTETAEQQHAVNNGTITFIPPEDPPPPPVLSESTTCYHPIDVENLRTWIYPTNYPVRGYQLNIVQKAMFSNTLVALPTGLGKTFIAAVVMYNYWRWFPNSFIIFVAPTRPLVTQQIEACFQICGLPQEDTCDVSGTTLPGQRKELYKQKRVFFATPQTIDNDLRTKILPANKIVCLVIDEAHRATGNYSYCKVIKKLSARNKDFRVLALTATPGSKLESVQNVVDNLQISNIQIRTEESMDIREFSYGKNIQSITVRLGYTEGSTGILPKVIQEFKSKLFEPLLKALNRSPAGVSSNVDSITTYGLTSTRKRFQATADNINGSYKYYIVRQILVAEQMSRAYDMLCQHGISSFIDSVESSRQEVEATKAVGKNPGKPAEEYYNNHYINELIPFLKREMLKPDFLGHPKMDKLIGILLKHFSDLPPGASSKVMIFSSFRSSVTEICRVLDRHTPLIRASFFVGQSEGKNGSKGLKQNEQQEVIQKFKRDEYNVLVATSIGEEGLDIGEVDLIVCYDSQASPIRMLQRMGRTGRKRQGKCIMLMTESEEKKFTQAKDAYSHVQRIISQGVHLNYFKANPSIIPANYKPTICRKKVDIGTYVQKEVKRKRRTTTVTVSNVSSDGLMNQASEKQFVRSLCDDVNLFTNLSQAMDRYWPLKPIKKGLNKYLPLQILAKPTCRISHSSRTLDFVHLVEKMEHRILSPNKEIQFTMSSHKPVVQSKLVLPSKPTLKLPAKRKKQTQAEALDDAFADFMEQNDISQFIDPTVDDEDFAEPSRRVVLDKHTAEPSRKVVQDKDSAELSSRRVILDDFFAPKQKKEKAKPASPKETVTSSRNKGKGKMRASQELSLVHDDNGPSMTNDEPSPIRDTFLPDSLFEDAIPLENNPVSTTELKLNRSYDQRNKASTPSPPPLTPEQQDMDMDMNDLNGDDFGGNSVFDDIFLAAENEALATMAPKGFDDILEPRFPFEKNTNDRYINNVTFVWTQPSPVFSEKAFNLLEKRQTDIKKLTGKFVTMNIFAKYKTMTETKRKPSPIIVLSQHDQSSDFEDDFNLESDFLEQAAALEDNLRSKPMTVSSPVKNENNVKSPTPVEEDEFGGFSDIDFDENTFANMIENKFSDDDYGFSGYMHEEEQPIFTQHASQMKERQSYYIDSSPIRPSPKLQEEDEEIYEIDFDNTPTPPAQQNEEVYEYSFSDSADDTPDLKPSLITSLPRVNNSNSLVTQLNNSKPVSPISHENDNFKPSLTPRTSPTRRDMESPTKLMQMSKMLGPPPLQSPLQNSPLRNSPLQNNYMDDSSDGSPIPIRRKRRIIESSSQQSQEDQVAIKPKKRLKQKPSTPLSDRSVIELEEDDDDDIQMYMPPSKDLLLQKFKQSRSKYKSKRRIKQTIDDLAGNPFMDVEAEKSSDEGHTSDEEGDGGSSILNSFIDDESLDPESRISIDEEDDMIGKKKKRKVNMYMQSLMNDDAEPSHGWMKRFDANKWLNTEEDSIIDEADEEEEDPESITGFSSHIAPPEDVVINSDDEDDDFM